VVLSACQTGLGKMIRGEGIIGLSRAFMYAGTPSVVMSLWSVSDYSTSIFMQRYYENLIKKGQSKTQALRLTRISMIKEKEYAHPFYWAPFVLTGDWQ
jgi:CHAT domain-containing protein